MLHLLEKKEYQKHPGKLEGLQHILFLLKTQRVRSRVKSVFDRLNQIFLNMVLLVIALCNKRLGLEQTESGFLTIECRGGTECVFKYVCV